MTGVTQEVADKREAKARAGYDLQKAHCEAVDRTSSGIPDDWQPSPINDIPHGAPPMPPLVEGGATERVKPDGGGLRHNALKNRLDLVPPEWMWALGDVTTRGSLKYAERNWERGMKWSTMVGCTLRHLYKFMAGEAYDKEIGCHHLAMAAWNLLALMSYDLKGIGEDDIRTSTTMKTLGAVAGIPIEEVAAIIQAKKDKKDLETLSAAARPW